MKKKILILLGIAIIIVGVLIIYKYNINKVETLDYSEILTKLDDEEYRGLEEYFKIEYKNPKIIRKTIDGRECNLLSYVTILRNITDKPLHIYLYIYHEDPKVAEYFSIDQDRDKIMMENGGHYVEVPAGRPFTITNSACVEMENISELYEKLENFGKFIVYALIKEADGREFIEVFDARK